MSHRVKYCAMSAYRVEILREEIALRGDLLKRIIRFAPHSPDRRNESRYLVFSFEQWHLAQSVVVLLKKHHCPHLFYDPEGKLLSELHD